MGGAYEPDDVRWTDDHCHLGWDEDGDGGAGTDDGGAGRAIAEAREQGVDRLVTVGTDAERSAQAVELARRHPGVVWATVGLHPHEARHGVDGVRALLDSVRTDLGSTVVAVGECGLDYHYDHSPRPVQREAFAAQIEWARELDLALVVHTREAWEDTFAILDSEGVPERTVLHCFTGGPEEVRSCLDRGMYVSFSGIVTFKGASEVREAVALCPLDRVLVETDSPYLAPAPHRGRPNRPALLPHVGRAVAGAMGLTTLQVARATWANATAAYRL